jgi:hypothetical protein
MNFITDTTTTTTATTTANGLSPGDSSPTLVQTEINITQDNKTATKQQNMR